MPDPIGRAAGNSQYRVTLKRLRKEPAFDKFFPVAFSELVPGLLKFGEAKAKKLAHYYTGPEEHEDSKEGPAGYRGQFKDNIGIEIFPNNMGGKLYSTDPAANFAEWVWKWPFFRVTIAAIEAKHRRDVKKIIKIYHSLPLKEDKI